MVSENIKACIKNLIENNGFLKLHLGCGRNIRDGYLNIDQYLMAPGIINMDIFNIPIENNFVDEIFTEHMLEHLSKFEVPQALKEWARVLKPDGRLVMNLPNLEWCLKQWLSKPEEVRWGWQLDTIFGLQTHPGEFHKTGFTKPHLQKLLTHAGFNKIKIEDYWSHEQSCFWVEAQKSLISGKCKKPIITKNEAVDSSKIDVAKNSFSFVEKQKPFWSVMIPTYNNIKYLEKTLKSVLEQAPDSDVMQIEVVDDCSTQDDVEAIVKRVGGDRVSFYRQPKNTGLIANWNTCIQRARGHWVHILHQDDLVLPGFYLRLQTSLENEENIGAAFCRHFYINEQGSQTNLSSLERTTPGILENWQERIAILQRIQFASIVVKRKIYEELGGFDPAAGSAADWEMWKRISVHYPIWYEPEPLACFRLHSLSETSRLIKTAGNITDIRKSIEISKTYLPESIADELSNIARQNYALAAINLAHRMLAQGDRC